MLLLEQWHGEDGKTKSTLSERKTFVVYFHMFAILSLLSSDCHNDSQLLTKFIFYTHTMASVVLEVCDCVRYECMCVCVCLYVCYTPTHIACVYLKDWNDMSGFHLNVRGIVFIFLFSFGWKVVVFCIFCKKVHLMYTHTNTNRWNALLIMMMLLLFSDDADNDEQ